MSVRGAPFCGAGVLGCFEVGSGGSAEALILSGAN
jgi:hypothetical protein